MGRDKARPSSIDVAEAAIRKLRAADETASRRQDFVALRGLLDEDAVMLAPGSAPTRGRASLDASFERQSRSMAAVDILDYRIVIEELEIRGDRAIEWGRDRRRAPAARIDRGRDVLL